MWASRRGAPMCSKRAAAATAGARSPDGERAVIAVPGDASSPGAAQELVRPGDRAVRPARRIRRRGGRPEACRPAGEHAPGLGESRSTPTSYRRSSGCQAAIPRLEAGGAIVLIGSTAGVRGSEVSLPYATAKAGVSLLARDARRAPGRQEACASTAWSRAASRTAMLEAADLAGPAAARRARAGLRRPPPGPTHLGGSPRPRRSPKSWRSCSRTARAS